MAENKVYNINKTFPIYSGDGTSFHDLVLRKSTVESVVMSLGDKISGDVYYTDNNLAFTMQEYIEYNGVKYVLVNPPTVIREGLVKDNSGLNGMSKYSLVFFHPMYMLGNFPFTDIAVTEDEENYLAQNKTFSWIGNLYDFTAKINANLKETEWLVEFNDTSISAEALQRASELSDVLSFDKQFVSDALKTAYDTWEIPFTITSIDRDVEVEGQLVHKAFLIEFGLPSGEILDDNGSPFVFRFGQGVGLKNNSRTPKNNKIVTRIVGYGAERNIPYGYPQIRWYGDASATETPAGYPIYKGIVNGEYVLLIKHPFTRKTLMPNVYVNCVFNKVSPYKLVNNEVVTNPDYDPDIEIVDYYDADGSYANPINLNAPSVEIHQFEDIYPRLKEKRIVEAYPINTNSTNGKVVVTPTIANFIGEPSTQSREATGVLYPAKERATNQNEKDAIQALIDWLAWVDANYSTLPYQTSYYDNNTGGSYTYNCVVQRKGTGYNGIWVVEYTSDSFNTHTEIVETAQSVVDWDDTMNDKGEYVQSYFKIKLPPLGFDLYACASITENMQINMRSGACKGCTFDIVVDWDDYKKEFYTDNGDFDPLIEEGHKRHATKYPDSTSNEIEVIVKKDLDTFGTLMPNIYQKPKWDKDEANNGDEFVILGISLPQEYITSAQEELDEAAKQYMLENNVFYYDYPLKFDEYFLSTHQHILAQIENNKKVNFEYPVGGTQSALFIKQITIKYGESVLPQYDITLTDDVEVVLNKIGQVTEDVSRVRVQLSELQKYYSENLIQAINEKLSRVSDDIALGRITFQQGLDALGSIVLSDEIKSQVFNSGLYTGQGWRIDQLGNAEMESLRVRSYLEVVELLINRLQAQEGDTLFTDNDQIDKVERVYEQVKTHQGDNPKANGWYEIGTDENGNTIYAKTDDTYLVSEKAYYYISSYILSLKEKWDGYITSQQEGNILKGIINTLAARQTGISDENTEDLYYTSWMRVVETHNTEGSTLGINQIRVVLYGDDYDTVEDGNVVHHHFTPAGKNFAPCELMTVARWGCALDPNEENENLTNAERESRRRRQSLFYISTTDGRIAKLTGVNSPILKDTNYGTTLGNVPDFLYNSAIADQLIDGRDYLYAQGIIVGSIIPIDKRGNPKINYIDCGEWYDGGVEGATPTIGHGIYLCNEYNEDTRQWETHDVYYDGLKWRCLQHIPDKHDDALYYHKPEFGSSFWQVIMGDTRFALEFFSCNGYSFRRDGVSTTITARLFYGGVDISNNPKVTFLGWTRCLEENWNNGEEPNYTEQDETWNAEHKYDFKNELNEMYDPRTLLLSLEDMPLGWGIGIGKRAVFNCQVEINDGKEITIIENQIIS